MGCACGTSKDGKVSGCKNNGACGTGGCNKMNVFDWLSNMEMPGESKYDVVEVRFKNGRKDFYRNVERIHLTTGDSIIVEVPNGHHLGHVSLQGELVRLQMQKKNVANDGEIKKIYRIAHAKDLEKFDDVKKRELPTLYRTREIIRQTNLGMKLSDVEYQADNTKATFFYSADDRVDFRELIKMLATEFRIRVEMRQISLRQEAGRLGGIGVCGRELCCSTWLSDFKNVATSAARYQNLSLNPSKLSGQCGRLKCCLNYELETYMEALKDIPEIESPLMTEKGDAMLQKTDIFRKIMWFGYKEENTWYPINIERVNEILELNRAGRKPATLELNQVAEKITTGPLNSDLQDLDKKYKDKSKKKPKSGERQRGNGGGNQQRRENNNPNQQNHPNHPNHQNKSGDKQSGDKRSSGENRSGGPNQRNQNNPNQQNQQNKSGDRNQGGGNNNPNRNNPNNRNQNNPNKSGGGPRPNHPNHPNKSGDKQSGDKQSGGPDNNPPVG